MVENTKRPKKKGKRDNERFDSFLGLLILLAIICIVIRYFNQIMIAVAIFAAVAITAELIKFFKAEDMEKEEQD